MGRNNSVTEHIHKGEDLIMVRSTQLVAFAAAGALVLAACSSDDDGDSATETTAAAEEGGEETETSEALED